MESIQRYVFLLLFSDKFTQDVFKIFCLQTMSGRQADVRKIVLKNLKKYLCKNNSARYMLTQLFTSVSVNSVDIYSLHSLFTSSSVNKEQLFTEVEVNSCYFGIVRHGGFVHC